MSLVCEELSFGARLQQVSFSAATGQLVGIIGANGAGKTTLLQVLTGQLAPTTGRATFANATIAQLAPLEQRRLIGFLPQNPAAHSDITVAHFLRSGLVNLSLRQSPSAEVKRVVALLNIHDYLARPLTQLSGGEQRRVQLARALLGDQPWLACDEPTASLDLHYQLHVMQLLKRLAQQGKMITVALHDLSLAARFCDQLVLLHKGHLVAAGEPATVLTDDNLASAFGISARWLCTEQGVALLPSLLKQPS
ncbi:ABC transporter ATP-binding protein [Pseudidiomarina homiensis]|uniref:ABC transporter ATP-binding protein n=1 Tax=Pseudidiomarina homiensis TaxID=364198 RepID=UPI00215A86E1|nr:ABC transporter ATP-binding protein [Pseudidiomarina homiensis]